MKPTIGIIGGCGPLATVDIEHKILKATQRLFHPLVDQDYFNLIVYNRTQFYDRNDAITFGQGNLFDEYLHCTNALISLGVNIILIACQTAHVYLPKLQNHTKIPIIDIVQETSQYTSKISPHISKVGILSTEATQREKLYHESLAPYGIEVVPTPPHIQNKLMEAIYIIKTGVNLVDKPSVIVNEHYSTINEEKYSDLKSHPYRKILLQKTIPNPIVIIKEAIDYLADKGCKHVILGCTELPLVLPYINVKELDVILIDPNTVVAESAVCLAHQLEQTNYILLSEERTKKYMTQG